MGEAQLQAVKEYIAKHNLEDELSNAVNQAIKLDSDDPYRVISDYLRKFAKVRSRSRAQTPFDCCFVLAALRERNMRFPGSAGFLDGGAWKIGRRRRSGQLQRGCRLLPHSSRCCSQRIGQSTRCNFPFAPFSRGTLCSSPRRAPLTVAAASALLCSPALAGPG